MQTWLGCHMAVAVVQAGSYSSNSTTSLGTSICHECDPKKSEKEKRRRLEKVDKRACEGRWALSRGHIKDIKGVTATPCWSHFFACLLLPRQPGDFALNQHPPWLRVCPRFSALGSRASVRGQKHLHPRARDQPAVPPRLWPPIHGKPCLQLVRSRPHPFCVLLGIRTYPKAEGPTKAPFPGQGMGSMLAWTTFTSKVTQTRQEDGESNTLSRGPGGLGVKGYAASLLCHRVDPWPPNFHVPWAWPKKPINTI